MPVLQDHIATRESSAAAGATPGTRRSSAPTSAAALSASVLGAIVLITAIAPLATDMYVPAFPLVGRDLELPLAEAAAGFTAIDKRRAIKVLLRP